VFLCQRWISVDQHLTRHFVDQFAPRLDRRRSSLVRARNRFASGNAASAAFSIASIMATAPGRPKRAAMRIGAFCTTDRRSGAAHRANAPYLRLGSPSPSCGGRVPRESSRQTKPRSIRLGSEIVADRGSTARNQPRAPNHPKRQTVAPSCRAPAVAVNGQRKISECAPLSVCNWAANLLMP